MGFIERTKQRRLWRFKWHCLFAGFIVLGLLAIGAGMSLLLVAGEDGDSQLGWILGIAGRVSMGVAFIVAAFGVLVLTYENVASIKDNGEKLDNVVEMIKRQQNLIGQIARAVSLSDAAKEIAFRDTECMELSEAVLGKLHQHDFDATYAMIEAMAAQPKYGELAGRLRKRADEYRDAEEDTRVSKVIAHIDTLCDQQHWAQAAAQAENLMKAFSECEKALAMPARIREKKDLRKKGLLALWDKAVETKDTDRGLEVLKELDQYLTPNEGLALQESASGVFRNKLHNLGVQFALAVTERQWDKALQTARQITGDFPNTRMAREIRGKLDILQERARKGTTGNK